MFSDLDSAVAAARDVALLSIVGQGMAGRPGIAGKLFSTLGAVGVNVLAIAQGYTDEEIEQMSDYFAGQKFVAAKQAFDESQVKEGAKLHDKYCEKCHAEGGTSKEDDSGILAGQWTPYLSWTMDDYRAGDREMTKKMKKQVEKLVSKEGDAGLQALYNYYASQQ